MPYGRTDGERPGQPLIAAFAVTYGVQPGTARRAWCEEMLTAPPVPGARKRRPRTRSPAGCPRPRRRGRSSSTRPPRRPCRPRRDDEGLDARKVAGSNSAASARTGSPPRPAGCRAGNPLVRHPGFSPRVPTGREIGRHRSAHTSEGVGGSPPVRPAPRSFGSVAVERHTIGFPVDATTARRPASRTLRRVRPAGRPAASGFRVGGFVVGRLVVGFVPGFVVVRPPGADWRSVPGPATGRPLGRPDQRRRGVQRGGGRGAARGGVARGRFERDHEEPADETQPEHSGDRDQDHRPGSAPYRTTRPTTAASTRRQERLLRWRLAGVARGEGSGRRPRAVGRLGRRQRLGPLQRRGRRCHRKRLGGVDPPVGRRWWLLPPGLTGRVRLAHPKQCAG